MRTTRIEHGKRSKTEERYTIGFRPLTVKALADATNSHWRVKNGLHGHLDVTISLSRHQLIAAWNDDARMELLGLRPLSQQPS